MKLNELKLILTNLESLQFKLADGKLIPQHFHITEVGLNTRYFIDCGNKLREDKKINLQLWHSDDFDHRLKPKKFLNILKLGERKLSLENFEVEVEYQLDTISKFKLEFKDNIFYLKNTLTACLAEDQCSIDSKPQEQTSTCKTGSNCC